MSLTNQTSQGDNATNNVSTNVSQSTNITITNTPAVIVQGFGSLPTDLEPINTLIEEGSIITEVGLPTIQNYPWYRQPFPSFELRAPQSESLPTHVWGKLSLDNAFSNMSFRTMAVPPVGNTVVIDPEIFHIQKSLIDQYSGIKFDVQWMIHIPSPFGTAVFLEVQSLEYDRQTKCRSVKWKPATIPTIAVHTPFEHDKAVLQTKNSLSEPIPGFSSGSIKISCLDDNSTPSTLALKMVVGCAITNVSCVGLREITSPYSTPMWMKFGDLVPSARISENIANTMSGAEVEAEGGVGTDQPIIDTQDNELFIPINKMAPDYTSPNFAGAQTGLKELQALNSKWHYLNTYDIKSDNIGNWIDITIDPSTFKGLGDNFSLPWLRNILTTGTNWMDVIHGSILQVNLPRPPTISGVVEFQFGTTGPRYLCEFGSRIEIPCIPQQFLEKALNAVGGDIRLVNPWLKTHNSKILLRYRCLAFNSGVERLDGTIQLAIRPGQSIFAVPRRVPYRPDPKINNLIDILTTRIANTLSSNASESFTSAIAGSYELGNTVYDDGETEEEIPLDDFVINLGNYVLSEEPTLIDFNLPAIYDKWSESSDNPITQKIARWGRIIPTAANGFGPLVGDYVIKVQVPTGVTGQIHHVALPGDLTDEAVSRLFGFGKILGLAGSAISAVGGPLLHGVVNVTGTAATSAATMIGGPLLGGVANAGVNLITSLIPGGKHKAPPAQNPSVIGGQLPVSRWLSNIRPVKQETDKNPIFPKLLAVATQFLGNDLNTINRVPVEVFANFKYIKVARNVLNRLYDPIAAYSQAELSLTRSDLISVVRSGFQCQQSYVEGSAQNIKLKQLLMTCSNLISERSDPIVTLSQILAQDVSRVDLKSIISYIEEADLALALTTS